MCVCVQIVPHNRADHLLRTLERLSCLGSTAQPKKMPKHRQSERDRESEREMEL